MRTHLVNQAPAHLLNLILLLIILFTLFMGDLEILLITG